MIGFIDKAIGNSLLRILHGRREKIITNTLNDYRATRGADEQTLAALKDKLEYEMTRVYAIADESIVRERILRARYTFWATAAVGTSFVLSFTHFPVTTTLAPFFSPLVGAFAAWVIAIATIPVGFNTRVQGAMDSAITMFELEKAQQPATSPTLQHKVQNLQAEVDLMRAQFNQMRASSHSTSFWQRRTNSAPVLTITTPSSQSSFRP